jgi:hypothetical protein
MAHVESALVRKLPREKANIKARHVAIRVRHGSTTEKPVVGRPGAFLCQIP